MRGGADARCWRLEPLERREPPLQRDKHRLANVVRRAKRVLVPEAQHRIALRQQERVTRRVVRAVDVLAAVELDDELRRAASKIGEIRPDRRLAHELGAVQATIAQAQPELALGVRRSGAQVLGAGGGWKVCRAHRVP
jgi:hypothetical protein